MMEDTNQDSKIGGHVTDAECYNTFITTIRMEYVSLQVFLTVFFGKDTISGDIGSAYLNAETKEKSTLN